MEPINYFLLAVQLALVVGVAPEKPVREHRLGSTGDNSKATKTYTSPCVLMEDERPKMAELDESVQQISTLLHPATPGPQGGFNSDENPGRAFTLTILLGNYDDAYMTDTVITSWSSNTDRVKDVVKCSGPH